MHVIALVLAALAGTAMSALFSGMETGIYTLNRVRLEIHAAAHDPRASVLWRLLHRPRRLLAVILIGNNAANQLGAWSIAALLHGAGLDPVSAIIVDTVILVPVLLIFAEVLPKDLFRAHGDQWCYVLARPLRVIEVLLTASGLALLVEWFGRAVAAMAGGDGDRARSARQRVSDLLKEGVDAGVISTGQTALLDRAIQLGERSVQDLMVPWRRVGTISSIDDVQSRQRAIDSPWTRLPVVRPDGSVTGILSVIDLVSRGDLATSAIQPAVFMRPGERADTALRSLRTHRAAIGIVADSDGAPQGIVTVKDLVAPLISASPDP